MMHRILPLAWLAAFGLAACSDDSMLESPTAPSAVPVAAMAAESPGTAVNVGRSAVPAAAASSAADPDRGDAVSLVAAGGDAGAVGLGVAGAAANAPPGFVCNRSGGCWREWGNFHPNCPAHAWCIEEVGEVHADKLRAGLVEIQVGRMAPPFDEPLEWRMSTSREFPNDPHLFAQLRVRNTDCGENILTGFSGPDCIIRILPGQFSSMHDRRGNPKKKRALKVFPTDLWQPNPGYEAAPNCINATTARLELRGVATGVGRTRRAIEVQTCR